MKRDLPDRTKEFALNIIQLCVTLEGMGSICQTLGKQVLQSGTTIGACVADGEGAQNETDVFVKYSGALSEARETQYWLDLIERTESAEDEQLQELIQECSELVAILTTICKNLKEKRRRSGYG